MEVVKVERKSRKFISMRERCLSIILLASISQHAFTQKKQYFQYKDTTRYLVDSTIFKIKNDKLDLDGRQLRIISESQGYIKLKPFYTGHLKEEIEIDVIVEHDGRKGRLYVIIEGEKHEVELTTVFHSGSSGLTLSVGGCVNAINRDHYSHYSHRSSFPK